MDFGYEDFELSIFGEVKKNSEDRQCQASSSNRERWASEGKDSGFSDGVNQSASPILPYEFPSDDEDFRPVPVSFKRKWSAQEEWNLHNLAKRLAEIRLSEEAALVPDSSYEAAALHLDGIIGASSKGCPNLIAWIPPKRKQSMKHALRTTCGFCEQNERYRCQKSDDPNEEPDSSKWTDHRLKDSFGKVVCPILRAHVCPNCHKSGDEAHTERYCEEKKKKQLDFDEVKRKKSSN